MEKLFQAFLNLKYPLQLLIFPEGTDMDGTHLPFFKKNKL